MMQNKRSLGFLTILLILALALAACAPVAPGSAPAAGGESNAPAASEGPTTITWAFWGSPEEAASHKAVGDAFMQEHPEIQIEYYNEPWGDYFTKMETLWASGDSAAIPDVLFLWPTPKYAAQGVLENLDPYIEKSGYNLDDYWPALLESAKYDGSVYGFPRDIEVNILYYNKDLFDQAGVPYPDETWTWDDLASAAEQLTVKDPSGKTERYGLAMEAGKWGKFLNQNGGAILDDYRNPSKCLLTEEKSVQAMQFFADLLNNGFAMRDADLSQAGGDAAVFTSGKAAMIIQNSSRITTLNAAGMNYDVAVVPIPEGGQRWNGAGGAAWVMSSASDNKDAAWTFLSWLQSENGGEKLYAERGEIFPALQSTTNNVFLAQEGNPANKQAFMTEAAGSGIGGFGYFPEWSEIDSIVSAEMNKVWSGEAQPADVVTAACEQVDQFLADNGFPK